MIKNKIGKGLVTVLIASLALTACQLEQKKPKDPCKPHGCTVVTNPSATD